METPAPVPLPHVEDEARTAVPVPAPDAPACRLCWAEGDSTELGQLISPCSCSGSIGHVHLQCLFRWQEELHSRGLHDSVAFCELCHQAYRLPPGYRNVPGPSAFSIAAQTAAHVLRFLQAALGSPPTSNLLGHALSLYICIDGARYVCREGAGGYRRGVAWGSATLGPRPPAVLLLAGAACGAVSGASRVFHGLWYLQGRYVLAAHTDYWLRRLMPPRALRLVAVGAAAAAAGLLAASAAEFVLPVLPGGAGGGGGLGGLGGGGGGAAAAAAADQAPRIAPPPPAPRCQPVIVPRR